MKQKIFQILISALTVLMIASCSEEEIGTFDNENPIILNDESTDHSAHRNCGLSHKMEELLSDPTYEKFHQEKFRKLLSMDNGIKQRSNCSTPTVIPVAVHYQGISTANQSCLVSLAETQIDILNNDFTGTNSDINKWESNASSFFPGVSNGEACVKFVLANKNHPSGHGLTEGSPAVTINRTNGDRINAFSNYLNVFVRSNLGFLGESPLGGAGNGDGVLVDAAAFGAGNGCGSVSPSAPYNLGRTLTHEIGHYLLLDHIWGGGCNQDDDVSDTPNQNSDYGGCPSLGASSCGSTDMHMNYMDYTNDACMYMFSAGQATRMENYIASSLGNIVNNASNVIGDVDTNNPPINDDDNPTDDGDDNNEPVDDTNPAICDKPTSINVEIRSATSVTISWVETSDPIRYQIRYRLVGTSRWTRNSTINNSKTLTRLSVGKDYEYQIRTRCASGWTGYTSKKTFNTSEDNSNDNGGDSDCTTVTFELVLDQYGSETSWEMMDQNQNTIAAGGPYRDNQEGRKITKEFCLEDGCYTMYVDDLYGDGICCDYGQGYFKLKDDRGIVIAESDGYFGSYDYLDICVDGGVSSFRTRKADPKSKKLARKKSFAAN